MKTPKLLIYFKKIENSNFQKKKIKIYFLNQFFVYFSKNKNFNLFVNVQKIYK